MVPLTKKDLMERTTQKGNELSVFEYCIFTNTNSHPATGLQSSEYLRCHVSETCLAHKIQQTLGVYSTVWCILTNTLTKAVSFNTRGISSLNTRFIGEKKDVIK